MLELMSAVMDGEASTDEAQRLFAALAEDAELRGRWHRFHHAAQLMSASEKPAPNSRTLERRFAAALENERAHGVAPMSIGKPRGTRAWWRFAGGAAVAAAVALAVVTLLDRPATRGAAATEPVIAGVELSVPQARPMNAGPPPRVVVADIERQTQALMLLHVQHAAVSSRSRVMPVAKLAAFTSQSE